MQQEGARDMARDWWPGSYGRRVSRCYGCDFRGIAEIVPSPDNVEIGAQQNQVKAVYVSGRMIRDFNCIHGGAVYRHRRIELRYVDLAVAGFQDGKSLRRESDPALRFRRRATRVEAALPATLSVYRCGTNALGRLECRR